MPCNFWYSFWKKNTDFALETLQFCSKTFPHDFWNHISIDDLEEFFLRIRETSSLNLQFDNKLMRQFDGWSRLKHGMWNWWNINFCRLTQNFGYLLQWTLQPGCLTYLPTSTWEHSWCDVRYMNFFAVLTRTSAFQDYNICMFLLWMPGNVQLIAKSKDIQRYIHPIIITYMHSMQQSSSCAFFASDILFRSTTCKVAKTQSCTIPLNQSSYAPKMGFLRKKPL